MQDLKTLQPIEHADGSLSDIVYQTLRRTLRGGDVPAGTRLVEAELAVRLGVSRTPVREALRRLQSDGLIEASSGRGFVLVDLLADAEESFLIRQRLEGLAAYLAARRITTEEIEQLRALQERMEQLVEQPDMDVEELVRLNTALHDGINQAAGTARLYEMVSQLAPEYVARRVVRLYDPEQRARSVAHHRRILDALWRRDHDAAEVLVNEHIGMGKQVVLAYLDARR